jgi:DNA-binding SARP family transcriptional activator
VRTLGPTHAVGDRPVARRSTGPSLIAEVRLLGAFEARIGGATTELPHACQRLIALLALADRPLLRQLVAFSLWTDTDEDHALRNLRSALWRVRRIETGLVEAAAGRLFLNADVWVDVRAATEVAEAVLADCPTMPTRDGQRLLATGDLLVDWYDAWLAPERERLRQLRLRALEALSADLLARGDVTGALDAALAAVAAEPMRESAHRTLIKAHLVEGNIAEALRQYETYRSSVFTELGILPSQLMESLVAPIQVMTARAG